MTQTNLDHFGNKVKQVFVHSYGLSRYALSETLVFIDHMVYNCLVAEVFLSTDWMHRAKSNIGILI